MFRACPHRLRLKSEAAPAALMLKAAHGQPLILKEEGGVGVIIGYGSVWDAVDSYGERVKKGAFKNSLKQLKKDKRTLPMLWQHRSDIPIGIWPDLAEDDIGLKVEGRVNLETQRGREAWSDMKMGSVSGLSIGYYEIVASSWERPGNEPRDLIELDLREVSPVTFPALREAQIDIVKAAQASGAALSLRQMEADMRERYRWTRAQVDIVSTQGLKALLAREAQGGVTDDDAAEILKEMQGLRLPDFDLPD